MKTIQWYQWYVTASNDNNENNVKIILIWKKINKYDY